LLLATIILGHNTSKKYITVDKTTAEAKNGNERTRNKEVDGIIIKITMVELSLPDQGDGGETSSTSAASPHSQEETHVNVIMTTTATTTFSSPPPCAVQEEHTQNTTTKTKRDTCVDNGENYEGGSAINPPVSPISAISVKEDEYHDEHDEERNNGNSNGTHVPAAQTTQHQLEERVQELEEKLATLSRLLLMQQRPAASPQNSLRRLDAHQASDGYNGYNNNTILSVTPPASPSPFMDLTMMNEQTRNDGGMPVLESPAPSRRPTMELHSSRSDVDDDDVDVGGDYRTGAGLTGRGDDYNDDNNAWMKRHQRNFSFRVLHTDDFATITRATTAAEEAAMVAVEEAAEAATTEDGMQNSKNGANLTREETLRETQIELMDRLQNAVQANKTDQSQENHVEHDPSIPGLFLPTVFSGSDNDSTQPKPTTDDVVGATKTTQNKNVNLHSALQKRTLASSNIILNEPSSKDVVRDGDNINTDESPEKHSRSSVASALSSQAEKIGESTPSPKKQQHSLKRERSLSLASAHSTSNHGMGRSDHQGPPTASGISSTSNHNNNNSSNTSIKSKWLDYLNNVQESNYDTDKQMEEFVKVPSAVEGLLSYGFWICVDSFLYTLTILPIRFVWSCLLLIRFCVMRLWKSSVPEGPFRFNRRYDRPQNEFVEVHHVIDTLCVWISTWFSTVLTQSFGCLLYSF
jgi:hypothetical protein